MEPEKPGPQKIPEPAGPVTPVQQGPSPSGPPVQSPLEQAPPNALEAGSLVEVSDQLWEHIVEKNEKPVAVMFYSTSCPYCRVIEPYFVTYAKEFKDTVVFARLNIMSSMWTAERYGIRGTPTFKFFCRGKPVFEIVGAVFPAILKKMVEEVLVHGKECAGRVTEINYDITGYG
jgi:thioredoxin 1